MQAVGIFIAFLFLQTGPAPNTGIVTGQAFNGNGTPAANLRVAVLQVEDAAGQAEALMGIAQTDSAGRYRLDELPPGRYLLTAGPLDAPAYYPGVGSRKEAAIVTVAAGKTTGPLDFKVGFAASLKVTGPLLGIEHVDLQLKNAQDVAYKGKRLDRDAFEFLHLWPGRYQVTSDGAYVGSLDLLERDMTDLRFVPLTFRVGGHVTSLPPDLAALGGAAPQPGATVRIHSCWPDKAPGACRPLALNGRETAIDTDGSFQFEGVPQGTYQVVVASKGTEFARQSVTVDRNAEGIEIAFPQILFADIRIEGDGKLPQMTTTYTNGTFSLDAVPPHLVASKERSGNTPPRQVAQRVGAYKTNVVTSEGIFYFPDLPGGEYWITVSGLPPGWSIESMTSGNVDLTQSPLQVTNGLIAPRIDIKLKSPHP